MKISKFYTLLFLVLILCSCNEHTLEFSTKDPTSYKFNDEVFELKNTPFTAQERVPRHVYDEILLKKFIQHVVSAQINTSPSGQVEAEEKVVTVTALPFFGNRKVISSTENKNTKSEVIDLNFDFEVSGKKYKGIIVFKKIVSSVIEKAKVKVDDGNFAFDVETVANEERQLVFVFDRSLLMKGRTVLLIVSKDDPSLQIELMGTKN